jgi:WD40 repeat protein
VAAGDRLVSIGYDDFRLCLWDAADGRKLDERGLDARPCDLGGFPDGTRVAVVDTKGRVSIWPVASDRFGEPRRLRGDAGRSPRLAVGHDGDHLMTSGYGYPVFLWSVSGGAALDPLPDSETMRGVVFDPRGRSVAAGTPRDEFTVWPRTSPTEVGRGKTYRVQGATPQSDVAAIAISPDGRFLATGHMDASISLWDFDRMKQIHDFFVQDASARDVDFSPDGSVFATAHQNRRVYLWDSETGIELAILGGHRGPPVSVVFDPSHPGVFASGGETGDIIVWR